VIAKGKPLQILSREFFFLDLYYFLLQIPPGGVKPINIKLTEGEKKCIKAVLILPVQFKNILI
jgi:hypothetical protein